MDDDYQEYEVDDDIDDSNDYNNKYKQKDTQTEDHKVSIHIYIYMGGLALMVISTKNWEFLPLFMSTFLTIQPHLKSFNDFI